MKRDGKFEKIALAITRWIGSPSSVLVHSIFFVFAFSAVLLGYVQWNEMLLVLTTAVSLEAIYLSLFIQLTVNLTTASLQEVEQNLDEIQEDVGEIQKDVDEIQEDVDELQEDVEEMSEEDAAEMATEVAQQKTLADIQSDLRKLMLDIDKLQKSK